MPGPLPASAPAQLLHHEEPTDSHHWNLPVEPAGTPASSDAGPAEQLAEGEAVAATGAPRPRTFRSRKRGKASGADKPQKPPRALRLTCARRELTLEQEEFLGLYERVRAKKHETHPKWQHIRYRNHFIARAPSGKWYAQTKRQLGKGRGQLTLADPSCRWPHESSLPWKSADEKGGWYAQPTLRCYRQSCE